MGTCSVAKTESGIAIFNLYGQYRYGKDKRHLNYEALYRGLEFAKEKIYSMGLENKKIGTCRLGSGLAGGSWPVVKSMLEDVFKNLDIVVYSLENTEEFFKKKEGFSAGDRAWAMEISSFKQKFQESLNEEKMFSTEKALEIQRVISEAIITLIDHFRLASGFRIQDSVISHKQRFAGCLQIFQWNILSCSFVARRRYALPTDEVSY